MRTFERISGIKSQSCESDNPHLSSDLYFAISTSVSDVLAALVDIRIDNPLYRRMIWLRSGEDAAVVDVRGTCGRCDKIAVSG
jgi:hypothetical protein